MRQSIEKPSATSAAKASPKESRAPSPAGSGGRKNSVRRKKRPPLGSEEYCCEETMFAPRANRKPYTAATIPGRSGQAINSLAL